RRRRLAVAASCGLHRWPRAMHRARAGTVFSFFCLSPWMLRTSPIMEAAGVLQQHSDSGVLVVSWRRATSEEGGGHMAPATECSAAVTWRAAHWLAYRVR